MGQEGSVHYASYDGVLYDNNLNTLRDCPPAKKKINIAPTVTKFETNAFYGCNNLNEVYYDTDDPIEADKSVFYTQYGDYWLYNNATLYVPDNILDAIKQISPWKYFTKIKSLPSSSVEELHTDQEVSSEIDYYINLSGVKSTTPWNGLNIVVMRDGTISKFMNQK